MKFIKFMNILNIQCEDNLQKFMKVTEALYEIKKIPFCLDFCYMSEALKLLKNWSPTIIYYIFR